MIGCFRDPWPFLTPAQKQAWIDAEQDAIEVEFIRYHLDLVELVRGSL